ncbi:MAG: protein kinase [Gemmatimonadota bacterium]
MTDLTDRLAAALADRYRIERELGQGGMATVYLAHDVKHDRQVAVKVLRPELAAVIGAERFVQEIKTTANLSHPHILPLFDSGTADSFLYYVMPFIDGETLRGKLNRETQLGIEEAVRITREVADALEYAHQHGVVHRDIKPENILLQNGRPMVADFGIALAVSAAAGGRMTETGLSLGTPHYMSPEQATAEKDLTARADIYSLASVLYEMLTGSPPHVGASAQQIIMKIVTDPARPLTELRKSVPPHVAAATAKALEKLPADRFESAAAFSAALANPGFTLAGSTSGAAVSADGSRSGSPLVRWGGVAGLGLVAVSAALLLLREGSEAPGVIRFHLSLPSSHRLDVQGDEDAPFAISPDGTRIVYAAIDSGAAVRRLYIRTLDQIEGTPIQGTEDAISPFFSPDGLWVGFATEDDERLKKVPVTGGPAITLADDVQGRFAGASWGDDGNIVYTSDGLGLSRVRGTGGVPERLVTRDSAGDAMFWPSALPGGEAVLYQRCFSVCTTKDLAVLDIASGSVEVVVPGATRGWYIPTGHLIYATDNGAVYAVPFDPRTRKVKGSPVPVLDQVRAGSANGSRLAISPAGALIYLPGTSENGLQLVEVDRSGRETVVISRLGRYEHPRWSPTGDRVALTIGAETGNQIWIYDVASETLSQLTSEGNNNRPTWSPDGKRVAYRSTRSGRSALAWISADGSGPAEQIEAGDSAGVGTTFWTRDGAWVVTDGLADSSRSDEDIFAVGTGADRARHAAVATEAHEETGAVSPDGKWIAYGSDEGGQWQVYIRPFLKPGGRWLVSTGAAGTPLWTSNSEVTYMDYATESMVAAKLAFGPTVRVTDRTRLFGLEPYVRGGSSTPQYDVSRDGQRFLLLREMQSGQRDAEPIVVLHWFEEVKRRMAEQGGR